jgi:hypothetical protein
MALLRWFFRPPFILALMLGWLVVTKAISWPVWFLLIGADLADDVWLAIRDLRDSKKALN